MRAKWKITIAVSWIIFLACLHTIAFGDDHDMIFEELDSDIKQFRQDQSKISNDLVNLRIAVAHVTAHQHESQNSRLRALENELERLHGATKIMMWIISIIGLLTAPIAIAGVKRISKNVMEKANGS
jgi:peptidoglycan hydrolase CwlO-like protein